MTTTHLKKEIHLLHKETHQHKRDIQAAVDAVEGEQIGKMWSSRHKESKPRDTIKCLRDPVTDKPMKNSKRMAVIAAEYHENLQSDRQDLRVEPNEEELEETLNCVKAKMSDGSKRELTEQITEDEVRNAIQKTIKEKAPDWTGYR